MALPEQIGRYEIREVLGTGAMGSVYLSWDPKLQREVALKLVRADVSRDPKWRERFQREARAVAALKQPNIVEIYDYSGTESEQLYIVMERLDGDDLFNIVEERGIMPEAAVAAVGHELCLALGVAHEQGIIHRDLKPENVFISPNGRVVLTDFGIVKAVAEHSPVAGWDAKTEVIGTPGFMPPELMMNKELGPHSDVFALGALLYNIVTSHLPFDGQGPVDIYRAMMAGNYVDPRSHNPQLSPDFCDVLRAALEPKPKRRLQTVGEMRDLLKVVLAENGVSDLRDDLREYMHDSGAYAIVAQQRGAAHLVSQLKIATKDRDEATMDRLRKRLLDVDPDNLEVHGISGVFDVSSAMGTAAKRGPSERPKPARMGMLEIVFILVALGAGAYLLINPPAMLQPPVAEDVAAAGTEQDPAADANSAAPGDDSATPVPTPDDSAAPPRVSLDGNEKPATNGADTAKNETQKQPAASQGKVRFAVRGGPYSLTIDGKKLPKLKRSKSLQLDVGRHLIEARGRKGKTARRTIRVKKGETVSLTVETKRGRAILR